MSAGRLKVLFVQGAGVRAGAERALLARLRHLPDQGVDPLVVFLADGPFRDEVEAAGFATLRGPDVPHLRSPEHALRGIRTVASLVRGVDVVEACGEKMAALTGWAARVARRPAVYNLQDAPLRDPSASAVQFAAATGRHDAVVVPAQWMAERFTSRLRMRAEVIPNGIVFDDLPHHPGDLRGEAGWPSDTVAVGLFGRLVAWKGAEILIRAAALVLDREPGVRFLIAGGALYGLEPGFGPRVTALIRELNIEDKVHMTGHREDSLRLMLDCDVICHCSLEPEPFGMVVLEAMALGKPVIATRTLGPEELIEDDRTGVLLKAGDVDALYSALLDLVTNGDRRHALGRAARDSVRTRFSSEVLAAPLAALYQRVADAGEPL